MNDEDKTKSAQILDESALDQVAGAGAAVPDGAMGPNVAQEQPGDNQLESSNNQSNPSARTANRRIKKQMISTLQTYTR